MFEAGELVMLPFPFSDLSSAKRRPVLALTAPGGLELALSRDPRVEPDDE